MNELETRMKDQYENRYRILLPRRTYTIIRIDGRCFHTYTAGMARPFDVDLHDCLCLTAAALCAEIQGACLGFTQSDEISILLTDFHKPGTAAWFDGNLQKIASVSASFATMRFNILAARCKLRPEAVFDARAFIIPDPVETENYFICRQKDATRNSISMATQSVFSHKQLHQKNSNQMQEMLFGKGINWNDYPNWFKRGSAIVYEPGMDPLDSYWRADSLTPIFTADRNYLTSRVPRQRAEDAEGRQVTNSQCQDYGRQAEM